MQFLSECVKVAPPHWVQKPGVMFGPAHTDAVPDQQGSQRLHVKVGTGVTRDQLDVTLEENQLVIRGRQTDDKSRVYLHRGIAARQFQKSFLLVDGMEVMGAAMTNGLLVIDLARPEPEKIIRRIDIVERE